jgi:hypothetical protein
MSSGLLGRKPVQSITGSALGLERHYSVAEIAEMWGLSEKTVRRMFEEEDGVLQWGNPETAASAVTLRFAFRRVFCFVFIESGS